MLELVAPLVASVTGLVAVGGGTRVIAEHHERAERRRLARSIQELERATGVDRPLDARIDEALEGAFYGAMPRVTAEAMHIDAMLRLGLLTYAEWQTMTENAEPRLWDRPARFDPPTDADRAEARRPKSDGEKLHALLYLEPPRDSGEADAVNGPTALETHHELEGHASSTAGRRRTGSSSSAGDNTPARSPANPDARP